MLGGDPWVALIQRMITLSGQIEQVYLWATDRASIGLGMKAPVQRIIVLRLTCRAHGEDAHGGLVAVIGDILDYSEARATVGAVDERIAVAPVSGIKEFM